LRGLRTQLAEIEKKIEDSPERVAAILAALSKSKDVARTTRRRIKRDLKRFLQVVDHAQKVDFLARAIASYGPIVLSALKSLL